MINYEKLNLHFNPFSTVNYLEDYKLTYFQLEIENILNKLEKGNYAIQFIGRRGRGKSTHMNFLHQFFPEEERYYIGKFFDKPQIKESQVYFIDEMQRHSRKKIKKLLNEKRSYVISSHRNHSNEFKKSGLDYDVIKLKGLSYEKLDKIVKNRISRAVINSSQKFFIDYEDDLKKLHKKYKDNIRKILNEMYELFLNKAKD